MKSSESARIFVGYIDVNWKNGYRQTKKRRNRNWIKRRERKGYFKTIVPELLIEDTPSNKEMLRMNHSSAICTLSKIEKKSLHKN